MPRKPRQRDLDAAVVRAAPGVCEEILKRLQVHQFDASVVAEKEFVRGFKVCRDHDIAIVEAFKMECS